MSLTASQLMKAILDDRRATSEEESELRKNAQTELALKWKSQHDAKSEKTP
jgi:hypothetical protein